MTANFAQLAALKPVCRNDIWSMDFVADQLADGGRIRTLTVVDLFTRECLDIAVGPSAKCLR